MQCKGANQAGDGKGGMQLSFTMTLFPLIGAPTATFGYTANVTDGVVPKVDVTALPVNPLQSPTFKGAVASYQGGADTGAELVDGAVKIDTNVLKLHDGSADLLAGLVKLREGAKPARRRPRGQDQARFAGPLGRRGRAEQGPRQAHGRLGQGRQGQR